MAKKQAAEVSFRKAKQPIKINDYKMKNVTYANRVTADN